MDNLAPHPEIPETVVRAPQPKRRALLLAAGALGVIALLGGAAFVASRLLVEQPQAVSGPLGAGSPGEGAVSFRLEVEDAEELPNTPPDAIGLLDHRQDNSLFICSMEGGDLPAEGGVVIQEAGGGEAGPSFTTAGEGECEALVEVVVTGDTIVYEDVTAFEPGVPSSGLVQQEVAEGSIEEIDGDMSVTAWGERTGDRLVAQVLLYSGPSTMFIGGGPLDSEPR